MIVINWDFTDTGKKYSITLENSALTYLPNSQAPAADATFALTRATLDDVIMGKTTFRKEIAPGKIKVQGDGKKLGELMGFMDDFKGDFNIVTP